MAKGIKRIQWVSIILFVLALTLGSSCSPAASELSVFAAAGAMPAVDEICQKFEEQYETTVQTNYGGGGQILLAMIAARTGDLFIAPEQRFMETAREKQSIDPETIKSIAYMIPVIAVQKGNPKNITALADLARPGIRVAITWPETTLLGEYAPQIFEKAGLAGAIDKNIVTQAARPDHLLTTLVMGQVDAVIIWHFYQTLTLDKIEVIFLPPEQLTGIGEMQIAVSTYSKDREWAQRFIDFMTSAEGKAIFEKHGYFVNAEEVKKYW